MGNTTAKEGKNLGVSVNVSDGHAVHLKTFPSVKVIQDALKKAEETKEAPKAVAVTSPEVAAEKPKSAAAAEPKIPEKEAAEKPKSEAAAEATPEKETVEKKKINILFCVSEVQPYCATGGLGEVGGSLPRAVAKNCSDVDLRVVVPLYEKVSSEVRSKMKFLGHTKTSWGDEYCGVFQLKEHGVTYYFIDNEKFFKRDNLYGYEDDAQRFSFFARACLDTFEITKFKPDILHAHDWQSALAVIYLKLLYKDGADWAKIKSIFTLHNINYQGKFSYNYLHDVFGIPYEHKSVLEYNGQLNLVKGAIECTDVFSTVSPTYAQEIKTPMFAMGLENCVNANAHKLTGILNGIDYEYYNPKTDKEIFANYTHKEIANKAANKKGVQKAFGLQVDATIPLILYNGRLVEQKGVDMIRNRIDTILGDRIQMIVMGNGETRYESFFEYVENKYKDKFKAVRYSNNLSKKLYAAADLVLMPSLFEPCGLSQMIASRYGAIPIVRETGGLKDSIRDFGCEGGGNGYTFANYDADDMVYSIKRAVADFSNDGVPWDDKVRTVIKKDFSWKNTVNDYFKLYASLNRRLAKCLRKP